MRDDVRMHSDVRMCRYANVQMKNLRACISTFQLSEHLDVRTCVHLHICTSNT